MSDRNYWERHATHCDASLRWVLGRPLSRMVELAGQAVSGRSRVLEVAAGTGLVTSAIARTSQTVVATDYAAAMVEMLQRRVHDSGLQNVTCEQADIYSLPYEAEEFDAVVAANVLHLVPDLPAAMAALRRVLAPGGVLVAPTFCHDETWLSRVVSRLFALTGFPAQRRFTMQTLQSELESNGLQNVEAKLLPGVIPVTFVTGRFRASHRGPE